MNETNDRYRAEHAPMPPSFPKPTPPGITTPGIAELIAHATTTSEDDLIRAHAYERREQVIQALASSALAMVAALDRNVFPPTDAAAYMALRDRLFRYGRELYGRPAAPPPANPIGDRASPAAATDAAIGAGFSAFYAAYSGPLNLERANAALRAAIAAASAATKE